VDATLAAYPYAYGYRFIGASGTQWRTVLSATPGIRVPRFSNPLINYDGVPTGVPDDQPDSADNAHCINNTAGIVAAFRARLDIDCNGNGVPDWCDVAPGTSLDLNPN